jgi:spore coat polysaccharide biosynthesis protein SpsF
MKTAILVQARMKSTRLSGKMMIRVGGKAILQHVVDRLRLSTRIKNVIVLTSDEVSEDPIANWCRYNSVEFFRGPLEDVYGRFSQAVDFYKLDAFVRISADSPLIDPHLVDQLYDTFHSGAYDLVTNVSPRSFPKGESVEILRAGAFKAADAKVENAEDREHVTPYFYRHPTEFKIKNVANPLGDFSEKRMCVDTQEDLERFKQVVQYFNGQVGAHKWFECLSAVEPTGEVKRA